MSRCGSFAGYEDHRRAGESTCQPCRDANTARMKAYRQAKGRLESDTFYNQAKYLATQRLIRAHADEFQRLFLEEKMKLRTEGS